MPFLLLTKSMTLKNLNMQRSHLMTSIQPLYGPGQFHYKTTYLGTNMLHRVEQNSWFYIAVNATEAERK